VATIREIAEEAGVSVGTVSNVLNNPQSVAESTRLRVLEVMERNNYRPSWVARGLAKGRTRMLGLIVSNISNPFTSEIVRGASEEARSLGCSLLVMTSSSDGREAPEHVLALRHQWVHGIFLASQPLPEDTYRQLDFGDTPVLVMDHGQTIPRQAVGLVGFDWRTAGYQATRHLLDLGHTRIAYIGGIPGRSSTTQREEGWRLAMAEAGISEMDEWFVSGDYQTECGYQSTLSQMKRPDPPTAIVFANDMMALGAYQAAAELSLRIPDDFSIVGMDDNFFVAYLAPPLTTVHVPTRELGRLGVQMLVDPDDKQRQVRSLVLPTALVVRHSTAPPPH